MYNDNTFTNKLKSFDIYGKLQSKYLKPTIIGAICKKKNIKVNNTSKGSNRLIVNLDITLHKLPCEILSLDISDFTGEHTLNIIDQLKKKKLNNEGKLIGDFIYDKNEKINVEKIEEMFIKGEGCNLIGKFTIRRTPGNFHLSTHAFGDTIKQLLFRGNILKYNLSHTINHLSFGNDNNISIIKSKFNNIDFITPLDNKFNLDEIDGKIFEYYLNIIPTEYIDLEKNKYNIFQFTVNNINIQSGMLIPTIFFRFNISPILLRYTHFITNQFESWINVCAIIGGLFTLMSIFNSIMLKIFKKDKIKK